MPGVAWLCSTSRSIAVKYASPSFVACAGAKNLALSCRSRSCSTASSSDSLVGKWCSRPALETPQSAAIWTMLTLR